MADEFDQYKAAPPQQGDEFDQYKATQQAAPPTMGQTILQGAKDFGTGVAKGAANTLYAPRRILSNYFPSMKEGLPPPGALDPQGTMQSVGKGVEQAGEFLLPMGAESKLASMAPKMLQPAARIGAQALSSGIVNKAQGGNFGTGAAMGGVGGAAGEIGRAVAPGLARSALGIRTNELLHGAEPGEAALRETTGVRPSTIAGQARTRIGELTPQMEQAAAAVPAGAHNISPSLQVVDDAIQTARARNSPVLGELQNLRSQLTHSVETGQPLPPPSNIGDLVNRRRGVNDTIANWTREAKGDQGVARKVYGSMTDEVHSNAPETRELDQRISSLIPVAKHADVIQHAPGVMERSVNRFGRATGALVGGASGAAYGGHEYGLPGAIAGGLLGVAGPELIASPTTQMIGARLANSGLPSRVIAPATLRMMQQEDEEQQK